MSWSFVSGQAFTGASSGGMAASFGLAITGVTVGDLLVVNVAANGGGATPVTVSDGYNTYTPIADVPATLSGSWFYAVATTGGSLTVTATPSASCYLAIGVGEWQCAGVPTYVSSATVNTYGETATTATAAFSGAGNFLAVGLGDANSTLTPAISSPYTSRYAAYTSPADIMCGDQLNLLAASSPVSATVTISTNEGIVGCVAVFLEVASGGLFRQSAINGLGGGGPFFGDPLSRM